MYLIFCFPYKRKNNKLRFILLQKVKSNSQFYNNSIDIPQMQQQPIISPSNPSLPLSTSKPTKLPTLHPKPSYNEIYIKGQRPLAVYVKHGKKVLQKTNVIFIHGMTSTIVKALRVAQALRKEFPYLKYTVESDSVPTISKFQQKEEYQLKERSCVHIRLEKNFLADRKEKA